MTGDVLVVDDDPDMLDVLAEALESRGWLVRRAANGIEALERIRERLPDLVVTDLNMPVMSGARLIQTLRTLPGGAELPVLVLSAFGYEWEAELMGAQGYLRKPCDPGAVAQDISAFLQARRAVH